jgi:hypothetical protein
MAFILRRSVRQQPQGAVTINHAHPLARGLAYCMLGASTFDLVKRRPALVTGTSITAGYAGRARGFGPNFGVSSTDSINTQFTAHSNYRTYVVRVKRNELGGNGSPRFFDKRNETTGIDSMQYDEATSAIVFSRACGGFVAQWAVGDLWPLGEWRHIVVTMETTSTVAGVLPRMYFNGVEKSVDVWITNGGTWETSTNPFYVGNRLAANRVWTGLYEEFMLYDRILSPIEVRALYERPKSFLNSAIGHRFDFEAESGPVYQYLQPAFDLLTSGWERIG